MLEIFAQQLHAATKEIVFYSECNKVCWLAHKAASERAGSR